MIIPDAIKKLLRIKCDFKEDGLEVLNFLEIVTVGNRINQIYLQKI